MRLSTLLVAATAVGLSALPASGRFQASNRSMAVEQPSNVNGTSLSGLPGMHEESHANKQPVVPGDAASANPRACCSTGAPVCDPWC